MRLLVYLFLGLIFGIIMTKSEVISWYRIQEMFRFQSFHMYGVIGSAVGMGIIFLQVLKRFNIKSIDGNDIKYSKVNMGFTQYFAGGTIFGLGWAMTGACPGPLYTLFGYGYGVIIIIILAAIVGTATYGAIRHKLPHA